VDMVGAVIEHAGDFNAGAAENLRAPEVNVSVNDGRNYLLTTDKTYDIIIVDASPPIFSAGTVNLYSRDFLDIVKARLKPGGIFTLWLPLPCFERDAWQIAGGFIERFSHVAVWAHPKMTSGFFILGSMENEFSWPGGELERRIKSSVRDKYLLPLSEAGVRNGLMLRDEELALCAAPFKPVTDDRPYTEFPLNRLWKGDKLQRDVSFLFSAASAFRPSAAGN